MKDDHPEIEHSFDDVYKDKEEMFGHPYQELQDYFTKQTSRGTLLDVGSGQGRDTLFLSKLGYEVTAVDTSKVGIEQMLSKAKEQGLEIEAIVADVVDLELDTSYDVILFDMILHSFETSEQTELLKKYAARVNENGRLCIVFPEDSPKDHVLPVLNSASNGWKLEEEIVVNDVPKMNDEETDFTFFMMCLQRSS